MSWDRRHRQEAILREKIAKIVIERLSDPRIGFITITKAELSKDKRIARVSYTVLGNEGQRRTTQRALEKAAPRIVELLAPTLRMRMLPELRFVYDEVVQRESRVLDLIESLDIKPDEPEDAAGEADDAATEEPGEESSDAPGAPGDGERPS